jgi:hypothetical protein
MPVRRRLLPRLGDWPGLDAHRPAQPLRRPVHATVEQANSGTVRQRGAAGRCTQIHLIGAVAASVEISSAAAQADTCAQPLLGQKVAGTVRSVKT